MDRRKFISAASLAVLTSSVPSKMFGRFLGELSDEEICKLKFDLAVSANLASRPIGDVMVEIGKSFIGTEYVGHVLEDDGPEKLVVNLRALDCVTFYENCTTLARCVKMGKTTFDDYKAQLQFLRYRDGKIDGYPSRLHYTTDYWFNGEQKGIMKVMTNDLFGKEHLEKIQRPINFMTTHRDSYKHLETNDENFKIIKLQEDEINKRTDYYLPKAQLSSFEKNVKNGDLIGIVSALPGMDIAHTGVAVQMNDRLYFMHAPITGSKVQITGVPMHDYLAKNSKQIGIIVARVNEV